MVNYELYGFSKSSSKITALTKDKFIKLFPKVEGLKSKTFADWITLLKMKKADGSGIYYLPLDGNMNNFVFILKDKVKEDLEKYLMKKGLISLATKNPKMYIYYKHYDIYSICDSKLAESYGISKADQKRFAEQVIKNPKKIIRVNVEKKNASIPAFYFTANGNLDRKYINIGGVIKNFIGEVVCDVADILDGSAFNKPLTQDDHYKFMG